MSSRIFFWSVTSALAGFLFGFDNVDAGPGELKSKRDPQGRALAQNISRTWATFARTGNPNHTGIPSWPPYTMKDRATMVLNNECEVVKDPGRQDRLALEGI